ncbi:MAG: adenylate/guanylate cyclase domain-containing protein [Acidimicrobiales bacterium]
MHTRRVTTLALLPLTLAANTVGAVVIFVFFTFVLPLHSTGHATIDVHHRVSTLMFAALGAAFLPISVLQYRKAEEPVVRWLRTGGPPDDAARRAVLTQPLRQAAWSFLDWCIAAVAWGLLNSVVIGDGWEIALRISGGILLGGLGACAFAYLLVERQLRPLFAIVLADEEAPRPWALRTRTRVLVFWALSSGLPLLAIVLGPIGLSAHARQRLIGPAVFIAAIGLVAGSVTLFVATRAVTDPLDDVRDALARVQEGDLDVTLVVDNGGEVGRLQAGFNHMVAGLRERQELADLFGRHVGTEVAHQALERGDRLGGEQREVSVLFVDLLGSTALAARRPATEVVAVLNAMFDTVVATVTAEGGWVNKFEGDGALCVFGAPVSQADHAASALRSAIALHDCLVATHVDAAIAVSTGMAVAGNVGSVERFEYTVIGDPVNEASRLSEVAKLSDGRVLASGTTIAAADGKGGRWAFDGRLELRGRDRPTEAYRPA